ncbi:MAG: hypothetical protein Q9198_001197 [Flavoplaca austrocitrina]
MENSSDLEFEPLETDPRSTRAGRLSILSLQTTATADRAKSKRAVKVVQFEAFREFTLGQDPNQVCSGDDILRFIDTIIDHMRPNIIGKSAVSEKTVTSGIMALVKYGQFRWEDFKWTAYSQSRMTSWLDQCVKSQRLLRGRWSERVFVGQVMIARICKSWVQHALDRGVSSWDLHIAALLNLTLLSACTARPGDIGQSYGYQGTEFVKWEDVELLVDKDPDVECGYRIQGRITLKYEKGKKDIMNEQRRVQFSMLPAEHRHSCIVVWLLTHALRHGLVASTSICDLLHQTVLRADRKIQWVFPQRPVCCARMSKTCSLDSPATTYVFSGIMKKMCLVAGLLSRVSSRMVRYGGARDVSHLKETNDGYINNTVRQSLGHNFKSFAAGTTQKYADDPDRDIYAARASLQYRSPYDKPFALEPSTDQIWATATEQEVDDWVKTNRPEHWPNPPKGIKNNARVRIRKQREDEWIENAQPEPRPLRPSKTLIEHLPEPVAKTPDVQTNIDPRLLDQSTAGHDTDSCEEAEESEEGLEESDEELEVSNEDLERLTTACLPNSMDDTIGDNATLDYEEVVLAELISEDLNSVNSIDFISYFSRINVLRRQRVGALFRLGPNGDLCINGNTQEQVKPGTVLWGLQGNSRDPLRPWIYTCRATEACNFKTLTAGKLKFHEKICNDALAAKNNKAAVFPCPEPGCKRIFKEKASLRKHKLNIHGYVPKPCNVEGCTDTQVFKTYNALTKHKRRVHVDQASGNYPTRCTFPLCSSVWKGAPLILVDSEALLGHLKIVHNLTSGKARAPYMPKDDRPSPRDFHGKYYKCPEMALCKYEKAWAFRELHKHMIRAHKYSEEQ